MQLPVLDHNKEIDNSKMTIEDWKNKLQEETKEVVQAKSTAELAEEVLDVVQVCIGIISYLIEKRGLKLKYEVNRHVKKLKNRGWKVRKWIMINVIK